MSGRPRTAIGTYGAIHVTRKRSRTYVARTRYRDIDGRLRDVTATAESRRLCHRRLEGPTPETSRLRTGRGPQPAQSFRRSCRALG